MYTIDYKTIDDKQYLRGYFICDECHTEIPDHDAVFVTVKQGLTEVRKHYHIQCCPRDILRMISMDSYA